MKTRAFYKILPFFYKKLSIVIYKKLDVFKSWFIKNSFFGKNIHPCPRHNHVHHRLLLKVRTRSDRGFEKEPERKPIVSSQGKDDNCGKPLPDPSSNWRIRGSLQTSVVPSSAGLKCHMPVGAHGKRRRNMEKDATHRGGERPSGGWYKNWWEGRDLETSGGHNCQVPSKASSTWRDVQGSILQDVREEKAHRWR